MHFWAAYKQVADEYDDSVGSKYIEDLDNSLLFVSTLPSLSSIILSKVSFPSQAGIFSAVTTSIIVQILPSLQPNPSDLTNALLLRILQQNTSFGGADPLAPISDVPTSLIRAQSIFFASLSITLLVAIIAVFGKRWILHFIRPSPGRNVVERGRVRQLKLSGLQKWGLYFIMESLPVMLQFALLLFGVALVVCLWDIDISAAVVVLVVACVGFVFYASIAVAATIWEDCPFQTPFSALLPKLWRGVKSSVALGRAWLKRRSIALLRWIEGLPEHGRLISPIGRLFKTFLGQRGATHIPFEDIYGKHYTMALSNPVFWRSSPLFTTPIEKNNDASAAFWLLENSTDSSAASAVAAAFSEFQWPSNQFSETALIRLRDTYVECFRAPEFDEPTRLKALQFAAAHYVLYHAQLIWSASKNLKAEAGDLPLDLLLHSSSEEWGGDDVFEYLLHVKDRSEPVTSARFLSYIAPYWLCGDSDAAVKFRSYRLEKLDELVNILEEFHALTLTTLTECVLCVGAAMDFPLHPDDLIRVDKRCVLLLYSLGNLLIGNSDYFVPTFKMVVEHIHSIVLARGRRHRHATRALEILLRVVKHPTLILVDTNWIDGLLKRAAERVIDDDQFILFLKLSARRGGEDAAVGADTTLSPGHVSARGPEADTQSLGGSIELEAPNSDHTTFSKIMKNIQTSIANEDDWQDEAVYGGLVAIKGVGRLESSLFDDSVLRTLHDAMDKSRPSRVRKAAYDAMVVTQDQWLGSPELRKLEQFDIFRQLHSVVTEFARSDYYKQSFLTMIERLSRDSDWHPYLRRAMDIWLPFRHEGPEYILRIMINVGQFWHSDSDTISSEESLERRVEDEWAAVPGRPVEYLTVDRLEPVVEVTKQLKELSFDENDRRAVLAMVERVIPALESRCDDGYTGPGDNVREIVNDLIEDLRLSPTSPRRQSTSHW